MRTVASLIAELQKFPPDALAIPAEGCECCDSGKTGLVIWSSPNAAARLGIVPVSEDSNEVDGPAVIEQ